MSKLKRKRGTTLEQHLSRLQGRMSKSQRRTAESLVRTTPADVIRLAYRLLPSNNTCRLSAREQREFDRLLRIDRKAADEWRIQVLADKRQRRKERSCTKK